MEPFKWNEDSCFINVPLTNNSAVQQYMKEQEMRRSFKYYNRKYFSMQLYSNKAA